MAIEVKAGGEETVIESEGANIRVYTKEDLIVCRNRGEATKEEKDKWIVKNSKTGIHSIHKIDNMLEAAIILKSLGLNTSIMDVVGCKDME